MYIDIERLKTDAAYWDEVAPEGAEYFAQDNGPWAEAWYRKSRKDYWQCHLGEYWNDFGKDVEDLEQFLVERVRDLITRPTKPAEPEPMDDNCLAARIGEIGNQLHNLGCERQGDEDLAERVSELAVALWGLALHAPKEPADHKWDGEGLPEVGVECEFIHPGITSEGWQVGTIKAYFDDRVAIKSNPSIWPPCGYAVILIDEELKFRPIKSKHERQREELRQWFMENRWDGVDAAIDDLLSRYNLEPKP